VTCERHGGGRVSGNVFDRGCLRSPVQDVEIRAVVRLASDGGVDGDETRWIGKRQRLQEHAVNNAENRGVGADAERQHDHDQRAEAWGLSDKPECLAEIGKHEGLRAKGSGLRKGGVFATPSTLSPQP
jgi:hypothetical protein